MARRENFDQMYQKGIIDRNKDERNDGGGCFQKNVNVEKRRGDGDEVKRRKPDNAKRKGGSKDLIRRLRKFIDKVKKRRRE